MNEFVIPAWNYFGAGCLIKLKDVVQKNNLKKGLIITDRVLYDLGFADLVCNILKEVNVPIYIFKEVQSDPNKDNVQKALRVLKAEKVDFIVGLGGGSANDCAKAVSILANNDMTIEELEGLNKSKHEGMFLITINTTAGTASEISRAYLINDEEKQRKIIMKDNNALAKASFNDTDLMLKLPPNVTAMTGMDALTHAMESYVSNGRFGLTSEVAISAIYIIMNHLHNAYINGDSIEDRTQMIYAQFLAGMAFCNSGVGLVHAMAHSLGAVYHIPHGLANAILLPEVMEANAKYVRREYAQISNRVFGRRELDDQASVNYLIKKVRELSASIGTNKRLKDLGVKESDLEFLAEKTLADRNIDRNPFIPTKSEIIQIFKRVY